jgi:phospholipid/cholesterol/gamma-HCH transport system substrate-binding protein
MKDQRKTEIKVGIMVIAGVLLFIWILSWAKNYSLTSSEQTIKVKFDDVSGLDVGDNVTVSGVKKGAVENLKVQGDYVIVTLVIDDDVKLKEDAKFAISMLDLMGGKKVEISPGVSSQPLDTKEIQDGIFEADIPKVMAILGRVEGDLPKIISDLKISVHSINNYLSDNQLNSDIKTSAKNLSHLTGKLNRLLDENSANISELTKNSNILVGQMNDFLSKNGADLRSTVQNIKQLSSNTDTLITQLNSIAKETKEKKNNIGKLMYNEDIYNKLNTTLDQINELTKILLEQVKSKGINIHANIF